MLTLHYLAIINYKKIYYASKPSFDFGYNVEFLFSKDVPKPFGFIKIPVLTKIIDLKKDLESIKADFCKSTRREINRAYKENLEFIVENKDYDYFVKSFNEFAKLRIKLKILNLEFYLVNSEIFCMTACKLKDEILVMHLYLIDNEIKRVSIFKSVSHYLNIDDKKKRLLLARANKYLHFRDMEYFKNRGFLIYDFGGFSLHSANPKINSINEFKDRFGGEILKEYDYKPIYKYILEKIKVTKILNFLFNYIDSNKKKRF